MPFKVRPSAEFGIPNVFYSSFLHGQRLNVGPLSKIFPNPKANPQKLHEEVRIRIGAYNLELMDTNLFI